jgi:Kef-type K+ transport system membrane component KefB
VTQTASESEHRVFSVGTMLLLAGTAAYLLASALFAGFIAGLVWNVGGASGRERLARDVRHLQHPLVVMLLLMAGSRLLISPRLLGLVALYVVCRTAAKLAGGWIARALARDLPRDLGLRLVSPGVVGVAFALNALQARPALDVTATAFAIVVAGSIASDLVSWFAAPIEDRA